MTGDTIVWAYGTNGHLTLAALGHVVFRDGKVLLWTGAQGRKPVPDLPSEKALVHHLRAIYRRTTFGAGFDPLHLIRAANDLRPLGKKKALAVMVQYERLGAGGARPNWLYDLAFVLFKPQGAFPVPMIGALMPAPPKDPSTWPTYPLLVVDDVPYSFLQGVFLGGYPEPFEWYVRRASAGWQIRSADLRPPDDPFPTYSEALRQYERIQVSDPQGGDDPASSQFHSLLALVREVSPAPEGAPTDAFERLHAEFLRLGGRWDARLQRYVRRDGSWKTPPAPQTWRTEEQEIKGIPHLKVRVSVHRESSHMTLLFVDTEVREPGRKIRALLRAVDGKTGESIDESQDRVLDLEGGSPHAWRLIGAEGGLVRFEVAIGGKVYRSRVFKT